MLFAPAKRLTPSPPPSTHDRQRLPHTTRSPPPSRCANDQLVVPVAAPSSVPSRSATPLRRSDTLVTVADRFGVTVEQLRSWNHLTDGRIAAGRSLYVAQPVRLAPGTHVTRGRKGSKRSTAPSPHGRNTAGKSGTSHAATHTSAPAKTASKTSSRKHAH